MAIISDVHGNAYALEAVLKEIRAASPDLLINLGDQVEGSADPARAAELQAALGATEVRGNNEEKLWPGGRRTALSQQHGEWLRQQVPESALRRLAELPLTARIATGSGDILACHGTPESTWDSLLWVWDAGGFYRSRDPRELRQLAGACQAGAVLCGHTHRSGATRVGDTLVVNCGAVSDQVDGDPRARWTLLEEKGGSWTTDFRTTAYDVAGAVQWSRAHSPFGDFEGQLLYSGEMTGRGVV